jgi:hypothetical protein
MPTVTISIALIAVALSVLLIRQLWLMSKIEEYTLNSLYFCHRNKLSTVVADEMSQIWPISHILFEVWRWDFSRYIVHQDHFGAMTAFISKELQRKDLDLARWEEERETLGSPPSAPAAPTTPAPLDTPPDSPSK